MLVYELLYFGVEGVDVAAFAASEILEESQKMCGDELLG